MQIREPIRSFVIDNFLFGEDTHLNDETSFMNAGFIDSTGVLELIAFIEEHFGVTLADEDLVPDNLDSIDNVTAFVQTRLGMMKEAAA